MSYIFIYFPQFYDSLIIKGLLTLTYCVILKCSSCRFHGLSSIPPMDRVNTNITQPHRRKVLSSYLGMLYIAMECAVERLTLQSILLIYS